MRKVTCPRSNNAFQADRGLASSQLLVQWFQHPVCQPDPDESIVSKLVHPTVRTMCTSGKDPLKKITEVDKGWKIDF